jgi:hypothetical protein
MGQETPHLDLNQTFSQEYSEFESIMSVVPDIPQDVVARYFESYNQKGQQLSIQEIKQSLGEFAMVIADYERVVSDPVKIHFLNQRKLAAIGLLVNGEKEEFDQYLKAITEEYEDFAGPGEFRQLREKIAQNSKSIASERKKTKKLSRALNEIFKDLQSAITHHQVEVESRSDSLVIETSKAQVDELKTQAKKIKSQFLGSQLKIAKLSLAQYKLEKDYSKKFLTSQRDPKLKAEGEKRWQELFGENSTETELEEKVRDLKFTHDHTEDEEALAHYLSSPKAELTPEIKAFLQKKQKYLAGKSKHFTAKAKSLEAQKRKPKTKLKLKYTEAQESLIKLEQSLLKGSFDYDLAKQIWQTYERYANRPGDVIKVMLKTLPDQERNALIDEYGGKFKSVLTQIDSLTSLSITSNENVKKVGTELVDIHNRMGPIYDIFQKSPEFFTNRNLEEKDLAIWKKHSKDLRRRYMTQNLSGELQQAITHLAATQAKLKANNFESTNAYKGLASITNHYQSLTTLYSGGQESRFVSLCNEVTKLTPDTAKGIVWDWATREGIIVAGAVGSALLFAAPGAQAASVMGVTGFSQILVVSSFAGFGGTIGAELAKPAVGIPADFSLSNISKNFVRNTALSLVCIQAGSYLGTALARPGVGIIGRGMQRAGKSLQKAMSLKSPWGAAPRALGEVTQEWIEEGAEQGHWMLGFGAAIINSMNGINIEVDPVISTITEKCGVTLSQTDINSAKFNYDSTKQNLLLAALKQKQDATVTQRGDRIFASFYTQKGKKNVKISYTFQATRESAGIRKILLTEKGEKLASKFKVRFSEVTGAYEFQGSQTAFAKALDKQGLLTQELGDGHIRIIHGTETIEAYGKISEIRKRAKAALNEFSQEVSAGIRESAYTVGSGGGRVVEGVVDGAVKAAKTLVGGKVEDTPLTPEIKTKQEDEIRFVMRGLLRSVDVALDKGEIPIILVDRAKTGALGAPINRALKTAYPQFYKKLREKGVGEVLFVESDVEGSPKIPMEKLKTIKEKLGSDIKVILIGNESGESLGEIDPNISRQVREVLGTRLQVEDVAEDIYKMRKTRNPELNKVAESIGFEFRETRDSLLPLTTDDVEIREDLFPDGLENSHLSQQNTGNCFLLAALQAMKKNPTGRHAILKNIRKENGSYKVYVPRLGEEVTVLDSELYSQEIFDEESGEYVVRRNVHGQYGDKIIAVAFSKAKIREAEIQGGEHRYETDEYKAMHGGFSGDFFSMFLHNSIETEISVRSLIYPTLVQDERTTSMAKRMLLGASHGNVYKMLTAYTPNGETPYKEFRDGGSEFSGEYKYFMDPEHRFNTSHAYTVLNYEAKTEMITLANPHDTQNKVYTIKFNEFIKYFQGVDGVQIKAEQANKSSRIKAPQIEGQYVVPLARGIEYEYEINEGQTITLLINSPSGTEGYKLDLRLDPKGNLTYSDEQGNIGMIRKSLTRGKDFGSLSLEDTNGILQEVHFSIQYEGNGKMKITDKNERMVLNEDQELNQRIRIVKDFEAFTTLRENIQFTSPVGPIKKNTDYSLPALRGYADENREYRLELDDGRYIGFQSTRTGVKIKISDKEGDGTDDINLELAEGEETTISADMLDTDNPSELKHAIEVKNKNGMIYFKDISDPDVETTGRIRDLGDNRIKIEGLDEAPLKRDVWVEFEVQEGLILRPNISQKIEIEEHTDGAVMLKLSKLNEEGSRLIRLKPGEQHVFSKLNPKTLASIQHITIENIGDGKVLIEDSAMATGKTLGAIPVERVHQWEEHTQLSEKVNQQGSLDIFKEYEYQLDPAGEHGERLDLNINGKTVKLVKRGRAIRIIPENGTLYTIPPGKVLRMSKEGVPYDENGKKLDWEDTSFKVTNLRGEILIQKIDDESTMTAKIFEY